MRADDGHARPAYSGRTVPRRSPSLSSLPRRPVSPSFRTLEDGDGSWSALSRQRSRVRVPSLPFRYVPANRRLPLVVDRPGAGRWPVATYTRHTTRAANAGPRAGVRARSARPRRRRRAREQSPPDSRPPTPRKPGQITVSGEPGLAQEAAVQMSGSVMRAGEALRVRFGVWAWGGSAGSSMSMRSAA